MSLDDRYSCRAYLREPVPGDRVVVCAVSFGHADPEHPVNSFRTTRAPLADVVHRIDP